VLVHVVVVVIIVVLIVVVLVHIVSVVSSDNWTRSVSVSVNSCCCYYCNCCNYVS
jgi:hypothetical protein